MLGKTVLLHTADRSGARLLIAGLRAAGNEVVRTDRTEAAAELVGARAIDLALVDATSTDAARVAGLAAHAGITAVALTSGRDPSLLLDLMCDHGVSHLLARSGASEEAGLAEVAPRDLVVTVEKILRREFFGLDKYLPAFGLERCRTEITRAGDRDRVVAELQTYLRDLGAGRELAGSMALVADELITNAVYNAPRDGAGNPRYAHRDRREKIELDPWERVTVEYACDGERLALAVTDWFGALTPADIRESLRRCLTADDPIRRGDGGAGIGMYAVLHGCGQLVFNIEAGRRTEIIAIADLRRRMRGIRESGHSLHLFHDDGRAQAAGDGVPDGSIQLSDSMRHDLRHALGRVALAPAVITEPPATTPRALAAAPSQLRARRNTLAPEGLDTACGLVRGSVALDGALDVALRYLISSYAGAVAYEHDGVRLVPVRSAGRVSDWPRLRRLRIAPDDDCSIARLVAAGHAAIFRPGAMALDHRLARLAAGLPEATGLVIPITPGGTLRACLYAYAPRNADGLGAEAHERLRRELERAYERLGGLEDYALLEVG